MKKLLQILTLALLTFNFSVISHADDSKKIYGGYIVTISGDTLHGQIQMLSPTLNEVKVKFIDQNGKKQTFKAKELSSYSFTVPTFKKKQKGNQVITYVRKHVENAPIPFGPKDVLVERQATGKINLYNHYIETRAGQYAYKHYFLLEKDGATVKVDRSNFKKVVKNIVADYPELKRMIGKKGYGYKYMATIIKEYNQFNATRGGQMLGLNVN